MTETTVAESKVLEELKGAPTGASCHASLDSVQVYHGDLPGDFFISLAKMSRIIKLFLSYTTQLPGGFRRSLRYHQADPSKPDSSTSHAVTLSHTDSYYLYTGSTALL